MEKLKIFAKTVEEEAMQQIMDCIEPTVEILEVIKPLYNFKAKEDILRVRGESRK